ncbi:MAG: alpha-N-acetylglucosaminidase N-terminal domain-containing protein [Odoribacter sp.]
MVFEQVSGDKDFFELATVNHQLTIHENNQGSMARGLHHYLRYYLYATITWTGKNIQTVNVLPLVSPKVGVEAVMPLRYDLNYCTYSYSMTYWDWEYALRFRHRSIELQRKMLQRMREIRYPIATQCFENGLSIATFPSYSRRIPFVSSSSRNEGDTLRLHRGYNYKCKIIN